jgi:hypothetical protein
MNAKPGFGRDNELQMLCPSEFEVGLFEANGYVSADLWTSSLLIIIDSSLTQAFDAASILADTPDYLERYPLTIADYQEYGSSAWRKRFA